MSQFSHPNDIKLSKLLSWLLRHGATKEGLTLESGGFIDLQTILNLKQFKQFTFDDIIRVVNNNDKQRFTLRTKDNKILQIRANQGHSIHVDEKELLTLLSENDVPPLIYHGTYFSKIDSIKAKGLSKMNRNHIHFTAMLLSDDEVISGIRKNSEVVIAVDAKTAMKHGFKFYKSDNGVILCPGNEFGVIPAVYFKAIYELKTP